MTKCKCSANSEKSMDFLPLMEILRTACKEIQRKRKRLGRVLKVPTGKWNLKAELQKTRISDICLFCFPCQSPGDWVLSSFLKSRIEPGFRAYGVKCIKVSFFVLFLN